jgi:hypothetical protein
MAWGDAFYRKATEQVEAHIGEPVELIGWASRSGAMGSVIAGTVARGAATAMDSAIVTGVSAIAFEMARSKFATRFAKELRAALA